MYNNMKRFRKLPIIIIASEELEKIRSSVIRKIMDSNKSFSLKGNVFGEIEIILQNNNKNYNY
jgi:hydroxyethylthiazole kinase-like sugar kinase family protein